MATGRARRRTRWGEKGKRRLAARAFHRSSFAGLRGWTCFYACVGVCGAFALGSIGHDKNIRLSAIKDASVKYWFIVTCFCLSNRQHAARATPAARNSTRVTERWTRRTGIASVPPLVFIRFRVGGAGRWPETGRSPLARFAPHDERTHALAGIFLTASPLTHALAAPCSSFALPLPSPPTGLGSAAATRPLALSTAATTSSASWYRRRTSPPEPGPSRSPPTVWWRGARSPTRWLYPSRFPPAGPLPLPTSPPPSASPPPPSSPGRLPPPPPPQWARRHRRQ